ncbi:MAG: AI-2E family transporter [Clostridiales bacterium]|nr:AI-2E family transporter [Clostridiales bacterium]
MVFLIFMLAGRGKLKQKIEKSFSPQRAARINEILENIDRQIQKYLIIKTATSFISGLVTMTVLLAFGVDFAIVFGFLTFLLNFIPSLGSIAALILIVLIAAFQFSSPWPVLWILLILVFIDLLISNFVEPKLMGYGLGLSPLAVLFVLFFWGWLWGIPGMILAVPVMAVVKIVCGNVPSLQFVAEIISK